MMSNTRTVTVAYQVATYAGEIVLQVDENADREEIIARARAELRRRAGGSMPFGSESWRIRE